ncbi:MAG: hypothetical protein RMX68_028810 [Aulosira sp. ZfuVER01]|nr:hypothetical protein [Aulosira sp. ZfuVER01]MDZ8002085.1 hypothetical protein [Aulosira sp. DedVER01a]MDZ8052648.1 hypothetical protein [Aulosira sp. ZfuCHP01]
MRVIITAIFTVAAFALQEFRYEAKAAPKQTRLIKQSSQLIENLDRQAHTTTAPSSQNSPQSPNQSIRAINNIVPDSTIPNNIFTPHFQEIATSLAPGWVMRLPSYKLLDDKLPEASKKYTLKIIQSSSKPSLKINIFSCLQQDSSCLVGTIITDFISNIEAEKELKEYQKTAKSIILSYNIQGYLLEPEKQNTPSNFSHLIWRQDNQIYKVSFRTQSQEKLLAIVNSMVEATPIRSTNSLNETSTPPGKLQAEIEDSPKNSLVIPSRRPVLTTAEQLRQGEILTTLRQRRFLTPGGDRSDGLTDQPTIGFSWGVTNNLELTLDAQTVDNSGPLNQGDFTAQRVNRDLITNRNGGTNFFQELTLQAKQRLWQNENATQALGGVFAVSVGNGGRPFQFLNDNNDIVASGKNQQTVFSLELPYTITHDENWQFTLSPKIAFLPEDNALYLTKPPLPNSGSFGTTFGLAGGVSYKLNSRLILWGDAFVPFTGNNTINRDTGLPSRTVAYNAGLRYLVNPRLSTDLFVSNTLGNTGALSILADKEYTAIGFGVTVLPGITSANLRYPEHFRSTQQPPPTTYAGFSSLDGGTVPQNQLLLSLQGGGQGILSGIRYGILDDLEIGAFLDYVPGTIDESLLGFSGKIRYLHQADGDPFTFSIAGTIARANNPFVNFTENNRNRFQELGLQKAGFAFSNEKYEQGELFVVTISTPMHYQFPGGSATWLTPILGFVQRRGLEIAGFNIGGSVPLSKNLQAIAEVGLDLAGKGNGFIGNQRETIIPWTVGLRWHPGLLSDLQLEAYLTNRLGSSPFDSLRVKADNETTIGVGLLLPIQF